MVEIDARVQLIKPLSVCTLDMHLYYSCNNKGIFLIFCRLEAIGNSIKASFSIAKLKAEHQKGWKLKHNRANKRQSIWESLKTSQWEDHPNLSPSHLLPKHHQNSPLTFNIPLWQRASVQVFVQQSKTLRKSHIWRYKSKGFHPSGIQTDSRGGERKSTCNMLKAISMKKQLNITSGMLLIN